MGLKKTSKNIYIAQSFEFQSTHLAQYSILDLEKGRHRFKSLSLALNLQILTKPVVLTFFCERSKVKLLSNKDLSAVL